MKFPWALLAWPSWHPLPSASWALPYRSWLTPAPFLFPGVNLRRSFCREAWYLTFFRTWCPHTLQWYLQARLKNYFAQLPASSNTRSKYRWFVIEYAARNSANHRHWRNKMRSIRCPSPSYSRLNRCCYLQPQTGAVFWSSQSRTCLSMTKLSCCWWPISRGCYHLLNQPFSALEWTQLDAKD